MKRSFKITALFLAVLMMITSFAAVALAEGENTDPDAESSETVTETPATSGDPSSGEDSGTGEEPSTAPDPDSFTVNIEGASGVDVYFNDTAVSGTYTGTTSPISIRVEPKSGYKIVAAEFDYGGAKALLTETDGNKFTGTTLTLSAGYTYTLRITAELVPVPVSLSVETVGATGYSVSVNGTVIDLSATQIMSGSEVTVSFTVDGAFDSTLASLTANGGTVTLSGQSYTFVITADTKLVFAYGNLIPITVTLDGPGKLEFQKTLDSTPVQTVVNESNGTVTKTFYATKDEGLKIISTPALGYELGTVEISEPRRDSLNGVYFFIPSGATTVNASMKASQSSTLPVSYTVQINVNIGGKLQTNGQTVLGGMGTNIVLGAGESLTFTVIPDTGYTVDVVKVGGVAVTLVNNSYTISNLSSGTNVSVLFKSEAQTPETDDGIGVDDIDWSANPIVVDITGNKLVKNEVFAKIATLSAGTQYVEFRSENGTVYVPYGKKAEGSSATANLAVTPLTSGALYDIINGAINTASGGSAEYKAYSFAFGLSMPEGTMISFKLGTEFIGSSAVMLLYNSSTSGFFTKENAPLPLATLADGTSEKYPYDNEGILVLSKESLGGITIDASAVNEGGTINPTGVSTVANGETKTYYITAQDGFVIKQILVDGVAVESVEGQKIYSYTFENVTENHTIAVEFMSDANAGADSEGGGGITTVIVIIIIVLVAIAGAAALFIVKWRQEKF